jgi:hypothetical protein
MARRTQMIIKTFLSGRHKFIIAKQTVKNKKADQPSKYRKYIEKSVVLSLLITMLVFQIFPDKKKQYNHKKHLKISLEVVDIPITKQEDPPPPPPPVREMMTNYSVVIKNEDNDVHKIREKLEDVNLNLELETDNNLLANSQIDNITYANLMRNRSRFESGASLDINSELNKFRNHNGGGLDFNPGTGNVTKKYVDDKVDLDSPSLVPAAEPKKNEAKTAETELIKINGNQFLLKESESTIGTSEYRLWNKINAALDRLDKNRFGKLSQNVQRTATGLIVTFNYSDGIIHEIFWSKGGKVIIRVTGNRPQQQVTELQKAFDSLIRLTL